MGFDDVQNAAFQYPRLTTVRQPLQKMGAIATQTVLRQIMAVAGAGSNAFHARHLVDPEMVVRRSTTRPYQPSHPVTPAEDPMPGQKTAEKQGSRHGRH